ncbi:MAG: AAA family ATPase [Saprospirales bacterium]|nr:AAA family ATPase [Saprospirales bacterium]
MRLRSLDIKGFKSFADKTQINFEKNITGIVGPNGCGKSNVVDAIRWVLGEQKTKALRLEKMDNMIFNGTKDKAAANIAEVSLTLDNTRNLLPTEFQSNHYAYRRTRWRQQLQAERCFVSFERHQRFVYGYRNFYGFIRNHRVEND